MRKRLGTTIIKPRHVPPRPCSAAFRPSLEGSGRLFSLRPAARLPLPAPHQAFELLALGVHPAAELIWSKLAPGGGTNMEQARPWGQLHRRLQHPHCKRRVPLRRRMHKLPGRRNGRRTGYRGLLAQPIWRRNSAVRHQRPEQMVREDEVVRRRLEGMGTTDLTKTGGSKSLTTLAFR